MRISTFSTFLHPSAQNLHHPTPPMEWRGGEVRRLELAVPRRAVTP